MNDRPIERYQALDIITDAGLPKYTLLAGIDDLQLSVADFDENDDITKNYYMSMIRLLRQWSGLEQLCTGCYSDMTGGWTLLN